MENTFTTHMQNTYSHNELADMANHGANTGHHGLIWTKDLVELYLEHKYSIHEILGAYNDATGEQGLPEFVSRNLEDFDQFAGAMVYFAAEWVAHELTQGEYSEETQTDD